MDDPLTAQYAKRNGQLIIWYGQDRRVIMYPCDANRQLNFVCIHPREESDVDQASGEWLLLETDSTQRLTKQPGWSTEANKIKLLEVYKDFDPSLIALLDKAEAKSLKAWELLDMDVLSTWVNDRLALLGDAAHPFLPRKCPRTRQRGKKSDSKLYLTEFVDQGQGAGCAMEDAAALAVVLQRGVKAEEVPERLRLYEKIRMERANRVQEYSRLAGRDLGDKKLDSKANPLFVLFLLPPASHRSLRLFMN